MKNTKFKRLRTVPDGGASRACAGQPEDDARAVSEHKAHALLGGHAAVNGVCVLEVVCGSQCEAAEVSLGRVSQDLVQVSHYLVCHICVHCLVVITAADTGE